MGNWKTLCWLCLITFFLCLANADIQQDRIEVNDLLPDYKNDSIRARDIDIDSVITEKYEPFNARRIDFINDNSTSDIPIYNIKQEDEPFEAIRTKNLFFKSKDQLDPRSKSRTNFPLISTPEAASKFESLIDIFFRDKKYSTFEDVTAVQTVLNPKPLNLKRQVDESDLPINNIWERAIERREIPYDVTNDLTTNSEAYNIPNDRNTNSYANKEAEVPNKRKIPELLVEKSIFEGNTMPSLRHAKRMSTLGTLNLKGRIKRSKTLSTVSSNVQNQLNSNQHRDILSHVTINGQATAIKQKSKTISESISYSTTPTPNRISNNSSEHNGQNPTSIAPDTEMQAAINESEFSRLTFEMFLHHHPYILSIIIIIDCILIALILLFCIKGACCMSGRQHTDYQPVPLSSNPGNKSDVTETCLPEEEQNLINRLNSLRNPSTPFVDQVCNNNSSTSASLNGQVRKDSGGMTDQQSD